MNLHRIAKTFIHMSKFSFADNFVNKTHKVWAPKTTKTETKKEDKDISQSNEYSEDRSYNESRNYGVRRDNKESNSESRPYNKRPPLVDVRGPQNIKSTQFQQELDEEKNNIKKSEQKPKYKSLREASEDYKAYPQMEFKQLSIIQQAQKTGEEQVQKNRVDKKLLLEEYNSLKLIPLNTRKYSQLISLAGQLTLDYEIHFQEYLSQNLGFDAQTYSEYFNATIQSNLDSSIQQAILKKQIQSNLKNLEIRDIVLYYDLIFRTNLLPQQKCSELLDLISRVKRQNLKIMNLDLSHFNYIFNLETYSKFRKNYLSPVKAVQEYIQYNLEHSQNIKSLPELDMIFMICRDFTQMRGFNNHSDSCLQILLHLSKHNAIDRIPVQEIALWTKNYLKLEKGIKSIVPILNRLTSNQFIRHFDDVVRGIEQEGSELICLKHLRNEYQSLKQPSSVCLEVFCTLAERAKDWKLILDIFQTYGDQIKNKPQKSSHIYKKAIEAVLAQDITNNNINAVESLIQDAQLEQSIIPQFQQDIFAIKAQIKDGQYQSAFTNFKQNIIENQILGYQKDKIRKLLYSYIQESFGLTTLFDYNPQYLNARSRVDSLVNSLQSQQLKKMHQEESSDNTLLEALTFSEDPFNFWEDTQRMNAFYYLRNSILADLAEIEQLQLKIFNENYDKQAVYRRDALDDYEKYLGLEKKSRVQERRNTRLMQVIDSLKLVHLNEVSEEQLIEEFNGCISKEFLDKKIFGKMEDEFPELEKVLELREAIRLMESKQFNPNSRTELKDNEVLFDLGQELRDLEKRIEDLPVDAKEFLPKQIDGSLDQQLEQLQSVDSKDRDYDYPQLPLLDSPQAIKEFIQEYYDPSVNQYYLGSIQQNPLKPKDKPYGSRFITLQNLEEMKWRYYHLYNSGEEFINGQRLEDTFQNQIWDLFTWGIQNNEPMAIKLAEYYSLNVGVTIPIHLSKLVANYYKYDLRQEEANKKFQDAHKVIGPIQFEKIYNDTDSVFVKEIDKEILLKMECTFEFKGHARALLKTSYSNQRFLRYGVTMRDVIQSVKATQ